MKKLTPEQVDPFQKEHGAHILDVRSPEEFADVHITGAHCIPLETLPHSSQHLPQDKPILVYCRSGKRSQEAIAKLKEQGFENLVQLEGGILAYEKAGGKVRRLKQGIPIMQQVQVAAGSLVLLGFMLGWLFHPAFLWLSAFVGGGLIFAGLSGYCGMAKLLNKMPWNRSPKPKRPLKEAKA